MILVLCLVLGVVLFSYERLIWQMQRLKRDKSEAERESRIKAIKLVREARGKAVEIIGSAQVDAQKWQEVLDEEIEKLVNEQLDDYRERLQYISKDIESDVKTGAQDFRKVLEMETVGAEKVVARRVQDEFVQAEKKVEEYKMEMMAEIQSKAEVILERVVKEVFGKSLKDKDQEQLIIKALEEAKRENAI